jgi:hypothetical protein
MDTVAAVFMSRHAHDMIATRKRRFLDAPIFFLPELVMERTFFVILYHDILNRNAKSKFYFPLEGSFHLNPLSVAKKNE